MQENKSYIELKVYKNGTVSYNTISEEEAKDWIGKPGIYRTKVDSDYDFFISDSYEGAVKMFNEWSDGNIEHCTATISRMNTIISTIKLAKANILNLK